MLNCGGCYYYILMYFRKKPQWPKRKCNMLNNCVLKAVHNKCSFHTNSNPGELTKFSVTLWQTYNSNNISSCVNLMHAVHVLISWYCFSEWNLECISSFQKWRSTLCIHLLEFLQIHSYSQKIYLKRSTGEKVLDWFGINPKGLMLGNLLAAGSSFNPGQTTSESLLELVRKYPSELIRQYQMCW